MAIKTNDRGRVKSVEQGVGLLKVLAYSGGALSLKDLAASAGMPSSKAHRYLVSLISAGMVEQDKSTGRYRLGVDVLHIGLVAVAGLELTQQAESPMQEICKALNETVLLSVWGNNGATIIKMLEPAKPITVNVRVGFTLPLLASATGLVFAAYLPKEQIRELLRTELKAYAKGRQSGIPRDINQVRAVIEDIREKGISRVEGALLAGINSLGAPIFNHTGKLAGVLTILGPADEIDFDWKGIIANTLKNTAADISRRMGYQKMV